MRRTWKTVVTTLAGAGLLLGGGAAAADDTRSPSKHDVTQSPTSASAVVPTGTKPGSPPCKATSGNLVGIYKNKKWATLEIYWDGANKTNCAYLRHGPKVPAGKRQTYVFLETCKTSTKGKSCWYISTRPPYTDEDLGPYTSYAGKVSVKGVGKGGKPKCIYAYGAVKAKGKWREIDINGRKTFLEKGNHCG